MSETEGEINYPSVKTCGFASSGLRYPKIFRILLKFSTAAQQTNSLFLALRALIVCSTDKGSLFYWYDAVLKDLSGFFFDFLFCFCGLCGNYNSKRLFAKLKGNGAVQESGVAVKADGQAACAFYNRLFAFVV